MSTPRRGAPIELTLEAPSPTGVPRRLVLRPGQTRQVGRGASVDLSIPEDSAMSDVHFSVACDDSGGRVRDLRSRNGLFVNSERVSEARVADGDRVTAGRTEFVVGLRAGAAPVVARAPETSRQRAAGIERPYAEALRDSDPEVRRAALHAAATTRQPWLLEHCRAAARAPTPEARDEILLLASLAEPPDVAVLLELARNESLGPLRFEILGALGRPETVPVLLAAIASDDPVTSSAAARAFTKITGADIESGERLQIETTGDAADFALDVAKPSLEKATSHWRRVEAELRKHERLRCGLNPTATSSPRELERLDLESNAERIRQAAFQTGRPANRVDR